MLKRIIAILLSGLIAGNTALVAMQNADVQPGIAQKAAALMARIDTQQLARLATNSLTIVALDAMHEKLQSDVGDIGYAPVYQAGLAGACMLTAHITHKMIQGVQSYKDLLPTLKEIFSSKFYDKPMLYSLLSAAGFLYIYAADLGIPAPVVYTVIVALKLHLLTTYKDIAFYNFNSYLYSLGYKMCLPILGAQSYIKECIS